MCPATTKADAGTHTSVLGAAADGLIGWQVPEFGLRVAAGFQPLGRAEGPGTEFGPVGAEGAVAELRRANAVTS